MMNSKPISFIDVFGLELENSEQINSIEIPIIQRDYAQGRKTIDVTRIRNLFVDVLYKALVGGIKDAIKLDFVYGNIEEGKLIPLDGQQRLTTLFLLHWYLAKKEGVSQVEQEFLKNFTYKTRFSSQHFCESLVESSPNFQNENISDWIIDQNWFMYSWEKDPTISSMLVMIDKLHHIFREEDNLWGKLINKQYLPISFYFLPLQEMGLTDSLYIKMNSRGKPLTQFEHFKAEFEKIIRKVSQNLHQEFIQKIDVDWVDMFWKYRDNKNSIDDKFMKYYRYITEMICYEQNLQIIDNDFDLAKLVYSEENSCAKRNLEFLYKSLDCWLNFDLIDVFFNNIFSNNNHQKNKVCLYSEQNNLFSLCCNNYNEIAGKRRQFSLNNSLLLYGVIQYLINKESITEEIFIQNIRITRNLINNSQNEIRETKLNELIADVKNIIINNKIDIEIKGFNQIQKREEIEKKSWRTENKELINDLNRLEDHHLLQGCIAIVGLDNTNIFSNRVSTFIQLFNGEINYNKIRTALLTIGDYSQLISWRFLFGNKNDNTWRELFTPSNQRKRFKSTQNILLTLIDNLENDYNQYLVSLIDNYLKKETQIKDWKYYFIKYPKMRNGNSGVYCWLNDKNREKDNQYEVVMMNTSLSLGGKHWNPFLFSLVYDSEFKNQLSIEEYNSPVMINKTNNKIISTNNSWHILNEENETIRTIDIPQKNNTDIIDRLELIKDYLKEVLA